MIAARFAFIALLLVLLHLGAEAWRHRRRLRRIPLRIHVNGTRGKTSVTRLIAAALRQAGIRTLAKVTGDEPRLILPDGTEQTIARRGPARIQEQLWFIRQAVAWRAEAVVVECMALAPELQQVTEERMLRATIGVITNVRPDHFEVMGGDLDAVAAALARTIPQQGVLITAERRYFQALAAGAAARGSRIIRAEAPAAAAGNALPSDEHQAIVRAVCAELKLAPPEAGRPWTPEVWRLEGRDRRVFLLNAFSANDPVSTALLQEFARRSVALPRPWVALLNNRADRPRRMDAFLDFLQTDASCEAVALGGELGRLARRRLGRRLPAGRPVWVLESANPEAALDEIGRRLDRREFSVVGMGNARGLGLALAGIFREKGIRCH